MDHNWKLYLIRVSLSTREAKELEKALNAFNCPISHSHTSSKVLWFLLFIAFRHDNIWKSRRRVLCSCCLLCDKDKKRRQVVTKMWAHTLDFVRCFVLHALVTAT